MKYRIVLFVVLSFGGCHSRDQLNREELIEFTFDPENGVFKSVDKGPVTVEVVYRPKDIILEQMADSRDSAGWNETKKSLDSLDYFILKLSYDGKEILSRYAGDDERYEAMLRYLSETLSTRVLLKSGNQHFPADSWMFAPSFGMARSSDILVAFKSSLEKSDQPFTIVVDDAVLGAGRCELQFDAHDLLEVPGLKREAKKSVKS